MTNRMKHQRFITFSMIIVVITIVILLGCFIKNALWEKIQSEINISTEMVIEKLQKSDYLISNIQYQNSKDFEGGMYGFSNHGARFELSKNNIEYEILVVEAQNWELAKDVVKGSNKLNRKMNGDYGFSFYYGSIYISILPSDEAMAKELYEVLSE